MLTDKNSFRKLTGRTIGIIVMFAVCGLIIVVGLLCIAFLLYRGFTGDKSFATNVINIVLVAIYIFLIYMYVTLITRHINHSNELKDKFERQNSIQKLAVIGLVQKYSGQQIKICDDYLYGKMSRIVRGSLISRSIMTFEYLPLKDIAWVYIVKSKITPKMEATLAGLIAGVVLGYVLKDDPRIYQDMERLVGNVQFKSRDEKAICICLKDGSIYKSLTSMNDYEQIKPLITRFNPSCRFGLSKEAFAMELE